MREFSSSFAKDDTKFSMISNSPSFVCALEALRILDRFMRRDDRYSRIVKINRQKGRLRFIRLSNTRSSRYDCIQCSEFTAACIFEQGRGRIKTHACSRRYSSNDIQSCRLDRIFRSRIISSATAGTRGQRKFAARNSKVREFAKRGRICAAMAI